MTLYHGSVEHWSRHDAQLRDDDSFLQGILKDILRALIYLANRGLIHRDVKPDNILVESFTPKGPLNQSGVKIKCVLADFGLSKVISHHTTPIAIVIDMKNTRLN